MIRRFKLRDFLSYSDVDVELDSGDSTVAVVGDNGNGKSALLEAIPYALYGLGRGYSYELSRDTGDGSHECTVNVSGVPAPGDLTVVTRSLSTSGKGQSSVHVNGEVVATGQDTAKKVEEIFGMDGKTFMLTSFFGMESDNILSAVPSKRLEMLQSIAQTQVYSKMYQKVSERRKQNNKELDEANGVLEALSESDMDATPHKKKIESLRGQSKELESKMNELRSERNSLSAQDDAYRALLGNRSDAESAARAARNERTKVSDEVDQLQSEIESLHEESESTRRKRDELASELDTLIDENSDQDDIKSKRDDLAQAISKNETMVELLSIATKSTDAKKCPLCHSELGSDVMQEWEERLSKLDSEISDLRDRFKENTDLLNHIHKTREKIDELSNKLKRTHDEYHARVSELSDAKQRLNKVNAEVERAEEEYHRISERIESEFSGVADRIEKLNAEIEDIQGKIGGINSTIQSEKQAIERVKSNKDRLKKAKEDEKGLSQRLEALEIVAGAFSRYGIPKRMLDDLRVEIENRATEVFSEFDSGSVTIEDVEQSGKSGIEFYLYHESGKHRYKMLSQGQQAMFYFAVREAIAQVVAESRGVQVPFLVLDEITANLSPSNRDNLIRSVKHILQRRYDQVFMVSHSSVREIFDRNIEVGMSAGASTAEVT